MKIFIKAILVVSVLVGPSLQLHADNSLRPGRSEIRAYTKIPRGGRLLKLEEEISRRLYKTSPVPVEFRVELYSVYLDKGQTIGQVLADLSNGECWGECATYKPLRLHSIQKLTRFPDEEQSDLGQETLDKILLATKPYDEDTLRSFASIRRTDGSQYWSEVLYIVLEDRGGETFEIIKIEYIEGK